MIECDYCTWILCSVIKIEREKQKLILLVEFSSIQLSVVDRVVCFHKINVLVFLHSTLSFSNCR